MYYTVWYNRYNILCRAPDDERIDSFETCRADKNCGMKTDYKNCASRWSLTHCSMMHGTHNVKLQCDYDAVVPRWRGTSVTGRTALVASNLNFNNL